MGDMNEAIVEVWDAFGQFAQQMLGESCREEVMCALRKHKQRPDADAACGRCVGSLATKLQSISSKYASKVVATATPTASTETGLKGETSRESSEDDVQKQKEQERITCMDESLVQIRASKDEVERRIAAFIASKRADINDVNKREFCFGLPNSEEENSCARVDAVFLSYAGSSSRLRVSRVFNSQGPQTQFYHSGQAAGTTWQATHSARIEQSLEERLGNAERHLKMGKDSKADMFSRLKALEERILFLEGLSPEYFLSGVSAPKRMRGVVKEAQAEEKVSSANVKHEYKNLSDIDQRINALQSKLKDKMRHLAP